jgi:tetratricopeptide (TPR) repeat protein
MARADRRSVRSARSHAAASSRKRDSDLIAIEDTMFFSRIRRHAKWMFVFLALVFAVGFVAFGIGSDQGTGIGDILRDGGGSSSGNLSVGDAREEVQENPKSAEAKRNLATALQEDGQTDEAITVLTQYLGQRPKDQDALRELAGLHLGRANTLAQQAQIVQLRASYLTFGSTFSVPLDLGDGATLGTDPIDEAISTQASQQVSEAYGKAQASYQQAEDAYDRLAAVAPRDPNVQLELAQAAQQSGNVTKAIAAYQRFLVLAPDDPSASIVKQQIEQLKASQAPTTSG